MVNDYRAQAYAVALSQHLGKAWADDLARKGKTVLCYTICDALALEFAQQLSSSHKAQTPATRDCVVTQAPGMPCSEVWQMHQQYAPVQNRKVILGAAVLPPRLQIIVERGQLVVEDADVGAGAQLRHRHLHEQDAYGVGVKQVRAAVQPGKWGGQRGEEGDGRTWEVCVQAGDKGEALARKCEVLAARCRCHRLLLLVADE